MIVINIPLAMNNHAQTHAFPSESLIIVITINTASTYQPFEVDDTI